MGFLAVRPNTARVLALALVISFAVAGCRSLHLPQAGRQLEGDWLTEGGDPGRTYARDVSIRPPLEPVWEYNAGGGFGPASPLILNGSVIVGTRKGEIHAIDLESGRSRGVLGVGESVDGAPAIDRFGVIYVPVSWGRRGLLAYDLTRRHTRWRVKRVPVEAGVLLMGDRVVAADVESRVAAYDVLSGAVIWEHQLSDRAVVHAAPARISDTAFIVADDEGVVTAIDAIRGEVLWERALEVPVYASPTVVDDLIYVPTTRGALVAIDTESGAERFVFEIGHDEAKLTTPAVSGSMLIVGSSSGELVALDRFSGDELWSFDGEEAIGGAPLIADAVVYAADMSRSLRAFDLASGELLWETELEGRVKSAMAVGDGGLVVLAEPRNVYLFKPAETHAAAR
ncbi:MAG TPA: PQQ-binding-like beta-propeller repeat protein [Rhodothermales bacterium]